MNLKTILDKAKYDADNLITVSSVVKEINLEERIVTTPDNQEYRLNHYSEGKILDRLGIMGIVNSLNSRFKNHEDRKDIQQNIIDYAISKQKYAMQLTIDENTNLLRTAVGRRYKRVLNRDVMQDAISVYGCNIDERFSYYNETDMKVYFLSDEIKKTPLAKEEIVYGYTIGNSELGRVSLSVNNNITFLRCTNGLIMDAINRGTRIYHTNRDILNLFEKAMDKHLNDETILDKIDQWSAKPANYLAENLEEEETIKKLDYLLKRFGITKKIWRADLIGIMQEREQDLNGYWVGNAINYYGSNVVNNPVETQSLLSAAYAVMAVV